MAIRLTGVPTLALHVHARVCQSTLKQNFAHECQVKTHCFFYDVSENVKYPYGTRTFNLSYLPSNNFLIIFLNLLKYFLLFYLILCLCTVAGLKPCRHMSQCGRWLALRNGCRNVCARSRALLIVQFDIHTKIASLIVPRSKSRIQPPSTVFYFSYTDGYVFF